MPMSFRHSLIGGLRALPGIASRLIRARNGNVAITAAIAAVPLMGFTGAAIDYGLATRLQVKLQAATDATALALCKTDINTDAAILQAQAQLMASDYMLGDKRLAVEPLVITAGPPRKIVVSTHAGVDALFSGFVGSPYLDVGATAQCGTPAPKTFEVALVLDNTGSMNNSSNGMSKIAALRKAASNFVDYVQSNSAFAKNSRISVVPFAITVKLDPTAYATAPWADTAGLSSYHWSNIDKQQAQAAGFRSRFSIFQSLAKVRSSWAWAGCFESMPYPADTQDGIPTGNDGLYVPLLAPDEPDNTPQANNKTGFLDQGQTVYTTSNSYIQDTSSASNCSAQPKFFDAEKQACKYVSPTLITNTSNSPNAPCTSAALQRLTSDGTALKTLINSLQAASNTNIHEGLIWGWRTLSPISVFADGRPYTDATTSKILILMTDGFNVWGTQSTPNKTVYGPGGYIANADGSNVAMLPANYKTATSGTQLRNALDQISLETCTNAKAAGVSIYTIGFSIPTDQIDQQVLTLLKNCASSASQAYVATDSNGLISAFDQIAKSIGSLRLAQ